MRAALLRHFDAHARPLPWRGTADPYAVLVSEVMLQQTRVTAVVPYYERWVRRFPDIATLADAPLDDVLAAWAGLGYYSRARNLHRAARIMRDRHAGAVPADYTALRALPGVGDYTAGAVASIAYGLRRPAIDGNVRRVVARLLDDPAPAPARLRALAETLVAEDRPGDLNQALMELGATICTPRAPRCTDCPIAQFCAARAASTQLDRPRRRRAKYGGRSMLPPLWSTSRAHCSAPCDSLVSSISAPSTTRSAIAGNGICAGRSMSSYDRSIRVRTWRGSVPISADTLCRRRSGGYSDSFSRSPSPPAQESETTGTLVPLTISESHP